MSETARMRLRGSELAMAEQADEEQAGKEERQRQREIGDEILVLSRDDHGAGEDQGRHRHGPAMHGDSAFEGDDEGDEIDGERHDPDERDRGDALGDESGDRDERQRAQRREHDPAHRHGERHGRARGGRIFGDQRIAITARRRRDRDRAKAGPGSGTAQEYEEHIAGRPQPSLCGRRQRRLEQEGIGQEAEERGGVGQREEPIRRTHAARIPSLDERARGGEEEVGQADHAREQRQDAQGRLAITLLPCRRGDDRQRCQADGQKEAVNDDLASRRRPAGQRMGVGIANEKQQLEEEEARCPHARRAPEPGQNLLGDNGLDQEEEHGRQKDGGRINDRSHGEPIGEPINEGDDRYLQPCSGIVYHGPCQVAPSFP